MAKVKLISVFNHRYDKNIDVLKRIYKLTFSKVQFLVPFYDGNDPEVISVTHNVSYNFQGFFWEGLEKYYDDDVDYYLFLADDAILNPNFSEGNIAQILMPKGELAYISGIYKLNKPYGIEWAHAGFSNLSTAYIAKNFAELIPSRNIMLQKMQSYFGEYDESIDPQFCEIRVPIEEGIKRRRRNVFNSTKRMDNKIRYPLAYGWSDIVIVHKSILKEFTRLCGMFAAMHMFCEIAIPTGLVYICAPDKISTLPKVRASHGLKQRVLWGKDREAIVEKYQGNLNALIEDFSDNCILIHPIKLSQWKTDKKNNGGINVKIKTAKEISAMIRQSIVDWHQEASERDENYQIVTDEIRRIRALNVHRDDLDEVIAELVKTNSEMWHEEDKVRSMKDDVVLRAIRNINPLNQHRNDLIEEIDEIFLAYVNKEEN